MINGYAEIYIGLLAMSWNRIFLPLDRLIQSAPTVSLLATSALNPGCTGQYNQPPRSVLVACQADGFHYAVEHFAVIDLEYVIAAFNADRLKRIGH